MVIRLQHLASAVDHHLNELRIAEALEAIIHQLKAVCPAVSPMSVVDISLSGEHYDECDGTMG